jgi:type I restriction enzyme, S subunit
MVDAMEIQKGFKQTEVGVIPGDWDILRLIEISAFENGKAHEQFIDDMGDYVVVNSKFISTDGEVRKFSNKKLSSLNKGNITIVMSDIPNGKALAKCYLVEKDNRYTLNQRIGCIKPNEDIDNDYLFYKLNRNKYFLAFDSGSGQTNLKKSEILDCPVALPPTKAEQTAIATALNDADALITQLEKLIAKKQAIKQGAMQELLKPKDWGRFSNF